MSLEKIRIVLVEPAGSLNIGSIARVMKNMGLNQLVLVNPQGDRYSAEARQMAVHGVDVLEKAQIVDNLTEALTGCHRAIATTARERALPTKLETPREALPWLMTENANINSALIFGSEERGLSNEELNYAQRFVRIPTNNEYSSLNLAQAVAICAYELKLAQETYTEEEQEVIQIIPTSLDALEGYYQQLEELLLKIGYLYPHTAKSRMEKFRRMYNRSNLSQEELAMLRGMIRQIDWAIH